MISFSSISASILVAIVYLLILPFQLVILPMHYYSVKDVVYSANKEKAIKALSSRFCFILLLCIISWIINSKDKSVVWGITIGSFLCPWPSIYHYQLFAFYKNKYKLIYFFSCVLSIFLSWATAYYIMTVLFPAIFESKHYFLLDNNGIKAIITILSYGGIIGFRKIITKEEHDNPYLVEDTFFADLYLTKEKILLEQRFFDQYEYDIEDSASKHGIDPDLLMKVVQLEKINRGIIYYKLLEKIAVRWIPSYLIKKDATIGLTQIRISSVKDYFHTSPRKYIAEMLKPEISIDLCAYTLKQLLDEYDEMDESLEDFYDDPDISEDFLLSVYIASRYVCGKKKILSKFILIYATIINDTAPATKLGRI